MRSDSFIESLLTDTAESLRLARQRPAGIREVVYVYLCRAYEAQLSSNSVRDLLGVDGDCVLNRANLETHEEEAVLDAYAAYDLLLQGRYAHLAAPVGMSTSRAAISDYNIPNGRMYFACHVEGPGSSLGPSSCAAETTCSLRWSRVELNPAACAADSSDS